MAETYSQLNDLYQMKLGKELFLNLNSKYGDNFRVLDMGCGTGELTAFIADSLGPNSQVVGVDPIMERINIAVDKNSRENLTFVHGHSSSKFPHHNEEYYDVHFSNFVLGWLNPQEQKEFIKTAFGSLRPGGQITLHSIEDEVDIVYAMADLLLDDGTKSNKLPALVYLEKKSDVENMLKRAGFVITSNEYRPFTCMFETVDQFLDWACATNCIPKSKLRASGMREFTQRFANPEDGTVNFVDPFIYRIIAMKPE